jgi:EAL domain-containing protein (putative c-di-GMP-specific phosphodiesterase class I)
VVLLAGVGESDACAAARRVLEAAQRPFSHDGHTMQLSATVGLAMAEEVPADEELGPLEALLRRADGAMLAGKRSGKQRLQRISGDGEDPFGRAAQIRRRLLGALEEYALSVLYEPALDLGSGSCRVLEARLRWEDPELGTVSPGEFVPLAERSGQAVTVRRWLLERVCDQLREWALAGHAWQAALQASPGWLASGLVAADVAAALASHRIPPARLRIDVIGRLAPPELPRAREQLDGLRALGVQVGLDGYGSDGATLAVLRSLPFDVLRLDPSLTARVEADPVDAAIVAGIVNTAHALGMRVGASEVRRAQQLQALRGLGVEAASGPAVAGPLSGPAVAHALAGAHWAPACGLPADRGRP